MRKAFYSIGVFLFLITNCISLLVFTSLGNQKRELNLLRTQYQVTQQKLDTAMKLLVTDASSTKIVNNTSSKKSHYVMKLVGDYVHVYYQDGNTLYETTDILYSDLPASLQEELRAGKSVYSLEELYSFLETYTS